MQEWLEVSTLSFDWIRNLWFYTDPEIRVTSYALVAVFVSEDCGRDVFFAPQNRLEEAHLLSILLDEDECSFVKEQVRHSSSSPVFYTNFHCRYAMF